VFCPNAANANANITNSSSQGEKATFLDISHSSLKNNAEQNKAK